MFKNTNNLSTLRGRREKRSTKTENARETELTEIREKLTARNLACAKKRQDLVRCF